MIWFAHGNGELLMDLIGEERIAAPRDVVWAAMNDPDIIRQCIPGCQTVEKLSSTEFLATVKVGFGLFSVTFNGDIRLSNVDAPRSYTISAEGRGGIAGFAKGEADVTLVDEGLHTLLRYEADGDTGGRIAELGGRLIRATLEKLARRFWGNFNAAVIEKAAG
jgi:carbon monoxide dehydrogenase subunit G